MIRAVVSDIEGTTSSIAFVHEVLFPYAREHLPAYVRDHRDDPAVGTILQDVADEAGRPLSTGEAIEQLVQWIDEDRKITPLKALQGLVWEHGYRNGDFFGHIYEDTVAAFRQWHAQGVGLYIYSSGSVQAQKLLFAHTRYGDLTPLFSGYFDTRIGAKSEVQSYAAIQSQLAIDAHDILFCSDVTAELDAAAGAGMKTCWFLRETATLPNEGEHPAVQSFADVDLKAF